MGDFTAGKLGSRWGGDGWEMSVGVKGRGVVVLLRPDTRPVVIVMAQQASAVVQYGHFAETSTSFLHDHYYQLN